MKSNLHLHHIAYFQRYSLLFLGFHMSPVKIAQPMRSFIEYHTFKEKISNITNLCCLSRINAQQKNILQLFSQNSYDIARFKNKRQQIICYEVNFDAKKKNKFMQN